MDKPALIVFDMIGTTVRGSELLPSALKKAFGTVGVNLSDDDITAARGKSKREAISSMLFEAVGAKKAGEYAMGVYEAFAPRRRPRGATSAAAVLGHDGTRHRWNRGSLRLVPRKPDEDCAGDGV